jgi:hypothetical protein
MIKTRNYFTNGILEPSTLEQVMKKVREHECTW